MRRSSSAATRTVKGKRKMCDCIHFRRGYCDIASQIASKKVKVSSDACDVCMAHDKPMQLNNITASLAANAIGFPLPDDKRFLINELRSDSVHEEDDPKKPVRRKGQCGTELQKIIPQLLKSKNCGCERYAKKMNAWGIDGCRSRKEEIVQYLVNKAASHRFVGLFPKKVTRSVATKWVNDAIANAEKKLKQSLPDNGNWFVAITTAPRKRPDLHVTLESIISAGWTPHIFSEPGVDLSSIDLPYTQYESRKGVWHNWLFSVKAALDSGAENILTVQDDTLFHPDCRAFTESILWPRATTGFISLYTAKHYSYRKNSRSGEFLEKYRRPPGVNRVQTKSFWGAMAMVFHRSVLEQLIEHPIAQKWLGSPAKNNKQEVYERRRQNPFLIQNSDTCIGRVLLRMGRDLMFVDPSPVQHISPHSSIGHGGNTGKRNCERCADHSVSLFEQVPVNFKPTEIQA